MGKNCGLIMSRCAVSIFLFVLLSMPVRAQSEGSSTELHCKTLSRPCVALVLGGGGARGSAHIGVLKVVEEMGLPVDAVVGTSIGSLVGGLFASGKSAQEIETLFQNADWNAGYKDSLSRSEVPVRRKRQLDSMPIHLDLGLDSRGLHLPRGVIQGQSMKLLVDQMLGHYPRFSSFDQLPIVYRAVAADAETGEIVVLDKGDLATAMQISMSLPGIVRPIRYEGRLLVDGGVADNLPIDVAKALGADIVIAVDIGSPALEQNQLSSGFAILRQLTSFLTQNNVTRQKLLLTESDILLHPDIAGVGLLSFDKTLDAVVAGYDEAKTKLLNHPPLAPLINLQDNQSNALHPSLDKAAIDEIKLVNNTRLSDEYILGRMRLEEGAAYSQPEVTAAVNRLYGLGTIARIRTFWDIHDGKRVLNIHVEEKEWGPGYINFKLSVEDDFRSFSRFQLGMSYLRSNITDKGGEWYSEIEVGTKKRLYSEIYLPISNSGWFGVSDLEYVRDIVNLNAGEDSYGEARATQAGVFMGLGWNFFDRLEVSTGPRIVTTEVKLPEVYQALLSETAEFYFESFDTQQHGGQFKALYDTYDHGSFPRSGVKLDVTVSRTKDDLQTNVYFTPDEDSAEPIQTGTAKFDGYSTELDAEIGWVGSYNRHSLRGTLRYQSRDGSGEFAQLGLLSLGGLFSLSGNPQQFVSGNEIRFASLLYSYELMGNHFGAVDLPLYLGLSIESGNAWLNQDLVDYSDVIYSASAYLGWDSPLGPLYLAYGRSDTDNDSFYFYLGKQF